MGEGVEEGVDQDMNNLWSKSDCDEYTEEQRVPQSAFLLLSISQEKKHYQDFFLNLLPKIIS